MSLNSMYMDTPTAEISSTIANLRKEESDRKAKNWKSAQDLLRGAAVDSIRSKYSDQIDWEQGVAHADKVFKVHYERLMAVDPQAAAQLAQEYKIEREKRVNKEVAAAYKTTDVDQSLKAMEDEVAALSASIQSDEINKETMGRVEKTLALNPPIDTGRMNQTEDMTLEPSQYQSDRSKLGEVPSGVSLSSLYSPGNMNPAIETGRMNAPATPTQQPLPSQRSGVRTPQSEAEAYGMTGYRPLSSMYGGR